MFGKKAEAVREKLSFVTSKKCFYFFYTNGWREVEADFFGKEVLLVNGQTGPIFLLFISIFIYLVYMYIPMMRMQTQNFKNLV